MSGNPISKSKLITGNNFLTFGVNNLSTSSGGWGLFISSWHPDQNLEFQW